MNAAGTLENGKEYIGVNFHRSHVLKFHCTILLNKGGYSFGLVGIDCIYNGLNALAHYPIRHSGYIFIRLFAGLLSRCRKGNAKAQEKPKNECLETNG